MPIVITTATGPPPVVEPPPTTTPPIRLPEIGFATATYYDPTGGVWPLTDPPRGWFTLADGVSGLGVAPIALTTDPYARGGVRVRHIQPQARHIVWPIHVYGATHGEFVARWRALGQAFASTALYGSGILEIARPDGARRQIGVYYEDGWEGQAQQGYGRIDDSAVVSLLCEDPYWVDPVPVSEHREYSGGSVDFLDNFFQLSSGRVLGATTLTNTGDVVAWPTWTITGPASLITITNNDTGQAFALNPDATGIDHGNLLTGEQVSISTNPPRVRYQNGDNWTGALAWPSSVLWGIPPGTTNVTFQLDGAAAGSAVDVAFTPRYQTA